MSKRLNSLERFRKQSTRLVLEQYDHCEVPAGCGGIILRWRNPEQAHPVRVHLYTPVQATSWIDGQPLIHGHLDLAPGTHVLAVMMDLVDRTGVLLLAALLHDGGSGSSQTPSDLTETALRILSAADGTWKHTFEHPGDGWLLSEFDDSAWPALVARPMPALPWEAIGAYQQRHCLEQGAAGLASSVVPGKAHHGPVWVRKVFQVSAPGHG